MDLTPKGMGELPIDKRLHNLTRALFYEFRHQSTCDVPPPFTLRDNDYTYDGVTYKSAYLIYMSCESEYEAAIALLGSYTHWKRLAKCSWFQSHLEEWRNDMDARQKALAKRQVVALTQEGNVTAARTLLAGKKDDTQPVGRPTKGKGKLKSGRTADIEEMFKHADSILGKDDE